MARAGLGFEKGLQAADASKASGKVEQKKKSLVSKQIDWADVDAIF